MRYLIAVVCLVLITGCSWLTDDEGIFRDRKKDYRKSESVPRMQMPAGFDSSAIIDYYVIPPLGTYADPEMIDDLPLPAAKISTSEGAVKIQKMGDKTWVLVNSTPSRIWPRLKQFIEQRQLQTELENGSLGIIEATDGTSLYRFKIEQGFQRNATEIYLRQLSATSPAAGFWPDQSQDDGLEQQMLKACAEYLANHEEQAAYSYAAQDISTTPKLRVLADVKVKQLLLQVSGARAHASLKNAFAAAGLVVESYDEAASVYALHYQPPLPEEKQPGFIRRLFGINPKPFDDEVEYADHHYLVSVKSEDSGMVVSLQLAATAPPQSENQANKERNTILDLIKSNLN